MEKQYNTKAALEQKEAPRGLLQGEEGEKLSQKDQAYIGGLMKMLHSKQTASTIDEMLQAGPPEQTIPEVAMMVSKQMEDAIAKKSQRPELETILKGGIYLVTDLVEIGNTGGFFQVESEEQLQPIMQATFQRYIEAGLKDGSIDPIELQSKVEPLLNEQQIQFGTQGAEAGGIPMKPDQTTQMSLYGSQMERKGMLKGGQNGL